MQSVLFPGSTWPSTPISRRCRCSPSLSSLLSRRVPPARRHITKIRRDIVAERGALIPRSGLRAEVAQSRTQRRPLSRGLPRCICWWSEAARRPRLLANSVIVEDNSIERLSNNDCSTFLSGQPEPEQPDLEVDLPAENKSQNFLGRR